MLCNAASVHEGLLFVMGGGITGMIPPQYPAPIPVTVAFIVLADELDFPEKHNLRVTVVDENEREVGFGMGEFEPLGFLDTGEVSVLPGALPLSGIALPGAGDYEVRITIDGLIMARLPLRATPL
jgi:hypothetical protein